MTEDTRQLWRDADGQIHIAPQLRNRAIGLGVVYIVFLWVFPIPLWQTGRVLLPGQHPQIMEAQAWIEGSLTLPVRMWDSAVHEGNIYSHFPPFMTFLSLAILPLSPVGIPFTLLSLLFVLPVPGLAYVLFLRRCGSVPAAVVLACTFVLGTSEFSLLCRVLQSGKVWQLNNAIAQLGLLLFLLDYFGKKRLWLGGIGLLICGWTRYTTIMYLVPFLWLALRRDHKSRGSTVWAVGIGLLLIGVPPVLNTLKFGNPLKTGYMEIYVDRDTEIATRAREHGLFSPAFVPDNLYWMNLGFPSFEEHRGRLRWKPNTWSTGIWWTTPLLLYLFVDIRRIWGSRENRWLLASVGVIVFALMMFHNPGWTQRGYNRFSMDFVLPLMVLIAPFAMEGKRRYVTPVLAVWSVVYFSWVIQ